MLGFCGRKSTTLFPHHRKNVGNYRDIVNFPYYGDSKVKPNCWDGTFLSGYQRLGKCGLSLRLPTLSLYFPYYCKGTFFLVSNTDFVQAYDQYNILSLKAMPMHHTVQFSVTSKIVHSCMKLGINRCACRS